MSKKTLALPQKCNPSCACAATLYYVITTTRRCTRDACPVCSVADDLGRAMLESSVVYDRYLPGSLCFPRLRAVVSQTKLLLFTLPRYPYIGTYLQFSAVTQTRIFDWVGSLQRSILRLNLSFIMAFGGESDVLCNSVLEFWPHRVRYDVFNIFGTVVVWRDTKRWVPAFESS